MEPFKMWTLQRNEKKGATVKMSQISAFLEEKNPKQMSKQIAPSHNNPMSKNIESNFLKSFFF